MLIPDKLKAGDEIRILTPSRSIGIISHNDIATAQGRLEAMGLKVTFGKHIRTIDDFNSSPIEQRIEDLHEAFADPKVKAIQTVIGGYNSNQLLAHLDFDLIRRNPKILCGYSDITALQNAIYARTGLVTYSGIHFSTLGMVKNNEYGMAYFQKCLFSDSPYHIRPAEKWSDDAWFLDQENRILNDNPGFQSFQPGEAEGTIVGGNLCTLNLLQGTPYMPDLRGKILFIEDDSESHRFIFDRNLQSLLHQPDASELRAVVFGRFERQSKIDDGILAQIIRSKQELRDIPIITNVDFGHTQPMITFPIGGTCRLKANEGGVELEILRH